MSCRVVIADDEMLVAMQLRHLMTSLGYEVVGLAKNGKEAVDLCHAERPDLALMDVKMPEMDGLTATRMIIETCPTCVVIVTGDSELDGEAAESGAMGFVVKPPGQDISSTIETARHRFDCFQEIREHSADIEEALKTWGLAWSAAKALVHEQGMSEAQACSELKRSARERGVPIRMAAEQVLARSQSRDASG